MTQDRRQEVLAIIPARGGSKGIPGKNLKLLAGRPLIAYSIVSARNAKCVSKVVVSTDDDQISQAAFNYGADVVRRPASISKDDSASEEALIHVLDTLLSEKDYSPDVVVFLQPTSPLRGEDDIDNAVAVLLAEQADSVFSSYAEHFSGRWRMDESCRLAPINYKRDSRPRRQDYPVEFVENGSIYVFLPDVLKRFSNRLGGVVVSYEMPMFRSLQIDTLDDLEAMEVLMSMGRADYE